MHMAQLMPLPLTVSCFGKIQIGFTFLVPAHPGSTGQGPSVKQVCDLVGARSPSITLDDGGTAERRKVVGVATRFVVEVNSSTSSRPPSRPKSGSEHQTDSCTSVRQVASHSRPSSSPSSSGSSSGTVSAGGTQLFLLTTLLYFARSVCFETYICHSRSLWSLSNTAIRPSVCPSPRRAAAVGTLAACSLAMCGLWTRPRTDVDPPRVELPSAGEAYLLAVPGAITYP